MPCAIGRELAGPLLLLGLRSRRAVNHAIGSQARKDTTDINELDRQAEAVCLMKILGTVVMSLEESNRLDGIFPLNTAGNVCLSDTVSMR